jgi:hypothetical protein
VSDKKEEITGIKNEVMNEMKQSLRHGSGG